MTALLRIGLCSKNSSYIPQRGEVIQCDQLGDGTFLTIHVGDGKTEAKNLPTLVDYNLHDRVLILETKLQELSQKLQDKNVFL